MTTKQKKIAVAKDVIAQVKASKFEATSGIYIRGLDLKGKEGVELQKLLRGKDFQPCEVCAIGACFLSSVRLFNKFKVPSIYGDTIDTDDLKDKVAELFTREEMDVIEDCFETNEDTTGSGIFDDFLNNLDDWERLLFLMQVVIDLKGREVTIDDVKRAYLFHLVNDKEADLSEL